MEIEPRTFSRTHFYLFLGAAFFLPVFIVACYAAQVRGVFFVTLLSLLCGGGGGWYLLHLWEQKMQRSVRKLVRARLAQAPHSPPPQTDWDEARRGYEHQIDLLQSSVAKSKEEVRELHCEMDKKLEEMRLAYLEFEDLRKEYRRLEEECAHMHEESQKESKHKESLILEYQRTTAEQRIIIEKKQRYIAKLEGKVRDLMYEIRSLLQLSEATVSKSCLVGEEEYFPPAATMTTHYDLSLQLRRFIEKAESQTGMGHLGGKTPRFLDASDSYAVDRRRLFDCFRDETGGIVYILSLAEKKFLFVNPHVKTVLGWSPEKFMKEFPTLVVSGYTEWKKTLAHLPQEAQVALAIQTKGGQPKELLCIMGMIAKGPFANLTIGVLH